MKFHIYLERYIEVIYIYIKTVCLGELSVSTWPRFLSLLFWFVLICYWERERTRISHDIYWRVYLSPFSSLPWFEVFYPLLDHLAKMLNDPTDRPVCLLLDLLFNHHDFKPGDLVSVATVSQNEVSVEVIYWISHVDHLNCIVYVFLWIEVWHCLATFLLIGYEPISHHYLKRVILLSYCTHVDFL